MKILGSISKALKGNAGKYITKGVGLAALGLVASDAHYIGKLQADLYASEKDAKAAGYYLNNSMYTTNMSKVEDGIRNAAYEMELDQGWRRFFNLGIGYVKGFTSMLVSHVIPFGLGLGALLAKGKSAKICAGAFGVYALGKVVKDFFGIGVPGNGLDIK